MTNEDLLKLETKYVLVSPEGKETNLYTEDAMVAAYNKALEDAIKSVESEPDFDIVYIKRLKIQ